MKENQKAEVEGIAKRFNVGVDFVEAGLEARYADHNEGETGGLQQRKETHRPGCGGDPEAARERKMDRAGASGKTARPEQLR